MKPIEKVRPIITEKFKDHPNFYRIYDSEGKMTIAFSDLVIAITPVGWDVYFVEVLHRKSPTEVQLAFAKLCKSKEELFDMLDKTRDTYEKPKHLTTKRGVGFRVDLWDMLFEHFKDHPKFIKIYESYKKLFIVFDDILILIEPMGGTFYNWELFKREGDVEVSHSDAGIKVGFDRIVDVVVEQRKRCDTDT